MWTSCLGRHCGQVPGRAKVLRTDRQSARRTVPPCIRDQSAPHRPVVGPFQPSRCPATRDVPAMKCAALQPQFHGLAGVLAAHAQLYLIVKIRRLQQDWTGSPTAAARAGRPQGHGPVGQTVGSAARHRSTLSPSQSTRSDAVIAPGLRHHRGRMMPSSQPLLRHHRPRMMPSSRPHSGIIGPESCRDSALELRRQRLTSGRHNAKLRSWMTSAAPPSTSSPTFTGR